MKPIAVIALSLVISAAAAAAISYAFLDSAESQDRLSSDSSPEVALARAEERITRLEEANEELTRRIEQDLAAPDMQALRRLRRDMDLKVNTLESEVAKLQKQLAAGPGAGGRGNDALAALGEEEAAAAIEDFISNRVEEQVQESRRRQMREQWAPMIRGQMMAQIRRSARRLELDPAQTERLEETATRAFERVTPAIGVMMDGTASPEEKEQAFADIDAARTEVSSEAESFMTPEQYAQFQTEVEKDAKRMEQMRNFMSGGKSGRTAGQGSSRAPAPPSGN